MENTPKKIVDEERLKKLAAARKKALEVRQKKAELNRAKKQEQKEQFQQEYEEKVLKKKNPPKKEVENKVEEKIEETDKDIYEDRMPVKEAVSDDDYPIEMVSKAKSKKKAPSRAIAQQPQEPNYKQIYYQHKLAMLQAKQQQDQFNEQYSRLPPYAHTLDIAKNSIKERVDKVVYDEVYKQLFSC
jgi:hypothetical protein